MKHVLHLSPLELLQTRLPFPEHLQALLALFKPTIAGQRLPLSLVQVDDVVQRVLELVDGSLQCVGVLDGLEDRATLLFGWVWVGCRFDVKA